MFSSMFKLINHFNDPSSSLGNKAENTSASERRIESAHSRIEESKKNDRESMTREEKAKFAIKQRQSFQKWAIGKQVPSGASQELEKLYKDLKSVYVPEKRSPKSLAFCTIALDKAYLDGDTPPNPHVLELENDIFFLSLIVGKEAKPWSLKRADYLQCCDDAAKTGKMDLILGQRAGKEWYENTALLNALFNDNEDCAIAIALHHIKYAVPLDLADFEGKTPLMTSAVKGHNDAFEIMLAGGARPDATDNDGNNVLHYVCMRGNRKALDAVQEKYGNEKTAELLRQKNQAGKTPIDMLHASLDYPLIGDAEEAKHRCSNGIFNQKFSIDVGRLASETCDEDTNVSGKRDQPTLYDVLSSERSDLRNYVRTQFSDQ